MRDKIEQILEGFIAVESLTDSPAEIGACEYMYDYLSRLPYFQAHPEQIGAYAIPDDVHGRQVFYALVTGPNPRTFVAMGHFDVVEVEEYGSLQEIAFNCQALSQQLGSKNISAEARADLESGEWIFGRGTADMKGGLAIHMALLEEYAEQEEKDGAMLLIGVPDEESYSAGMRAASRLMVELKEKYGLDYRLMIDPEPNMIIDGQQVVSTGSVGKCMPVVMVQGVKAHVGRCFEGFSPLSVLSEIYRETEMSMKFTDSYQGETTLPPIWAYLKDRKEGYDVSLPYRAGGYFTVLSLAKTPQDVMDLLVPLAREAFSRVVARLDATYQEFRQVSKFTAFEKIYYEPLVLTFAQLKERLSQERGAEFETFYSQLYEEVCGKVVDGQLNYPEATIELMERLLNWSGIQEPLVLLGFAPPYYPAVNCDNLKGREMAAEQLFAQLSEFAGELDLPLMREYYFTGISDLSYCGIDKPFDYEAYSSNTPMWGRLYQIDFESIAKAQVPSMIFGPWGKDLHKMTERVHRKSLTETVPQLSKKLRDAVWKG